MAAAIESFEDQKDEEIGDEDEICDSDDEPQLYFL